MNGKSIHPRTPIVSEARFEVASVVSQAVKTHNLTYSELLYILIDVASGYANDAIREERNQ